MRELQEKLKRIVLLLCGMLLALTGCGNENRQDDHFTIACTTYPVYLLANSIAGELDGVEVKLVINQKVSCLHDYALTVQDMKALEQADVIAINGAGLEDFLEDTLNGRNVIDCDEGIDLIAAEDDHEAHEEGEHLHDGADPHIWMDPRNYARMARNLANALAVLDSAHDEEYRTRGEASAAELEAFYQEMERSDAGQQIRGSSIITFHDGFAYFADAFGLNIAAAIEEEEGAEASAKELKEIVSIVQEQQLPAVFTEVNGSGNAAKTIAQECHVEIYPLTMCMSGSTGDTISAYETAIRQNLETIMEAYQ